MEEMKTSDFNEIFKQIQIARKKVVQTANSILIELYWNIGKSISQKVSSEKWGKGVVQELAGFISQKEPGIKGFSVRNLWRMKQFFDTYSKLPTVWTVLSWSHHRRIMTLKTEEERPTMKTNVPEICFQGFDPSTLRKVRQFFRVFPKRDALRHELSWIHYRCLLKVEDDKARRWYKEEAGGLIVENEQFGEKRAEYGKNLLKNISIRLTANFGRDYTVTKLRYMRQFYCAFPKHHAVSDELSWNWLCVREGMNG